MKLLVKSIQDWGCSFVERAWYMGGFRSNFQHCKQPSLQLTERLLVVKLTAIGSRRAPSNCRNTIKNLQPLLCMHAFSRMYVHVEAGDNLRCHF